MFDWVFDVPLWIAGPLLVLLLGGFAFVGLLVVRKRLLPKIQVTHQDAHFIGTLVHSVMVFYALVLALIAVNVFETYSEASKIVSTEATALAMLYRDVSCYPDPTRSELQTGFREYAEYVIHVAWPLQRAGKIPAGGVQRIDRVQATLAAFQPVGEAQSILHARLGAPTITSSKRAGRGWTR
jgi:hypothetical protein